MSFSVSWNKSSRGFGSLAMIVSIWIAQSALRACPRPERATGRGRKCRNRHLLPPDGRHHPRGLPKCLVGSGPLRLEGHFQRASETLRIEVKLCVAQRPLHSTLNKPRPESLALRWCNARTSVLPPKKFRFVGLGVRFPEDPHATMSIRQGAVFHGIRGEFVQRHCYQ